MQFRSLHSLARRALAAGAASALALTLFNAVQPTLAPHHQIGPGTIKDVPVTRFRPRPGLWTTPGPVPPGRLRSPSGGLSPDLGR